MNLAAATSDTIRRQTKESFVLAGRSLGGLSMAASIAATWIWAPAVLLAAQLGWQFGWWGVFWITVPNALCLVLFGYLAQRLRSKYPNGYTFSGYLRERHGSGVFALGVFEDSLLSVAGVAVQLLAGGLILSGLTGAPYPLVVFGLGAIVALYTIAGGFRASVLTDVAYLAVLLVGLAVVVPLVAFGAGFGALSAGAAGTMQLDGWTIAAVFGISATIGWTAGPFADQSYWQRAFATKRDSVFRTFALAAVLFAIVPASLAIVGVFAAGSGVAVDNPQLTALAAVGAFAPPVVTALFAIMLVGALASTIDSALSAQSSVIAADFGGADDETAVRRARFGIGALVVVGMAIALIPGLQIFHLVLTYGTLRAAAFLPGVLTIFSDRISARWTFWGIVSGLVVGVPLFVYGALLGGGQTPQLAGSGLAIGLAGVVCYVGSRIEHRDRFVRWIESPHGDYAQLRARGRSFYIAFDPAASNPEDFAILERDRNGFYHVADYPAEPRKLVR